MKGQYVAGITNLLQEGFVYAFLVKRVLKGLISIGDFTMHVSAARRFSCSLNNLVNSLVEIKQFEGHFGALNEGL